MAVFNIATDNFIVLFRNHICIFVTDSGYFRKSNPLVSTLWPSHKLFCFFPQYAM